MRRQDRYPDTEYFHFFNANPHKRITSDCTIRAISRAAEIEYNTVVLEMAQMQVKTGYDVGSKKLIDAYLKSKGWTKHKQPRKEDNTKYTGKEFCQRARKYERYIMMIGSHHIVAVVDGKVNDIWNCTNDKVGNYWTKG